MPLQLMPAVAADAARVVEIVDLAYTDDPLTPIFFPGPFPDGARETRAAEMANKLQCDATTRWMKVVDTDTGELIAFSHWNIYKPGVPRPPPKRRSFGPGCNIPACEEYWGSMIEKREKHMGDKPHVYLDLLVTDPMYQRKGAGSMLMKWGLEIADELKLPTSLDSSPYAHKLYLSCGFKDIDETIFDKGKYGSEGTQTVWCMERPIPE